MMMDFTMTSEQVAYLVGSSITAALLVPSVLKTFKQNKELRKQNRLLANQVDSAHMRINYIVAKIYPSQVAKIVSSDEYKAIQRNERVNAKAINEGKNI